MTATDFAVPCPQKLSRAPKKCYASGSRSRRREGSCELACQSSTQGRFSGW
jgi:hypothetical protein